MGLDQPRYHSFLLRLWRVEGEEASDWRVSLQDAATGQRLGFAGLEPLTAYLREQMEASGSPGPGFSGSLAPDQGDPDPLPQS
jgi:hypothetical protein